MKTSITLLWYKWSKGNLFIIQFGWNFIPLFIYPRFGHGDQVEDFVKPMRLD